MGAAHGIIDVGRIIGVSAFIEGHDDIGPQFFLDLDGAFRGEAVHGAINVAFECDAVFIYFAGV
ncbi:hypothetical protein SDC9_152194 [bioreactor metagenome]|uniref:Uncharacterized protein n=1 Tax=bioreactor metagenome TaxID=1076179 RepID=A0A645ESF1_9ZZZZ